MGAPGGVSNPLRCTTIAAAAACRPLSRLQVPVCGLVKHLTKRPSMAGGRGWVAEQEGCCPHLVVPVYAAAHGSTHGCQPASTPTHTLLACFHLMFAAPSTQTSSPPLLLMERHTAAGMQMCIIHLLQTQKQRKHVFPHFHTTLRDTLGWTLRDRRDLARLLQS